MGSKFVHVMFLIEYFFVMWQEVKIRNVQT